MQAFESEAVFNIGAAARMTGIPVATLHAWERRYDFPQLIKRTEGGHRLYSEREITLLRLVKAQVDQGVSARQAVAAVKKMDLGDEISLSSRPGIEPGTAPQGDRFLAALLDGDLARGDRLMGELLAYFSPEHLTLHVIGPALNAIGEAWEQGRIPVAVEHLATNYLRHRLLMWMVSGPPALPMPPVVLACAPGEWHEGSLLMLGVLLRRRGVPVSYLGQDVPLADLAGYLRTIQPSVVVLVAMRTESAQGLQDWERWIQQTAGKPRVAFGGRAFVLEPALQERVPGLYLGPTVESGFNHLLELLPPALSHAGQRNA